MRYPKEITLIFTKDGGWYRYDFIKLNDYYNFLNVFGKNILIYDEFRKY